MSDKGIQPLGICRQQRRNVPRRPLHVLGPARKRDLEPTAVQLLETDLVADAAQCALGHDADLGTQDLGLFHRVGRQDDGAPLLGLPDNVPDKAADRNIQACCRLVQEHNAWVANQGNGDRQTALLASTQPFGQTVLEGHKRDGVQGGHHRRALISGLHALEASIEVQVLADGLNQEYSKDIVSAKMIAKESTASLRAKLRTYKVVPEDIVLRADTNVAVHVLDFAVQLISSKTRPALSGLVESSQDMD